MPPISAPVTTPAPVNPALFAQPGESYAQYEARVAGGNGGAASAPVTPAAPVTAPATDPQTGITASQYQLQPGETPDQYNTRIAGLRSAGGMSTPSTDSTGAPTDTQSAEDKVAQSLGYKSYSDAVTALTAAPTQSETDLYNSAYSAAGLDTLTNTITSRKNDLADAQNKINDNPWLDESSRVGRNQTVQTLAQADISNLQDEYNMKLQEVHNLVTSQSDDNNASSAANKAKLATLESQAQTLAAEAATKQKDAEAAPTTIKGADGATYQWDATSGTFKQILAGTAGAAGTPGSGSSSGSGPTTLSTAGQAWVTAVLNGNSTMASVPAALKTEVAEGIANQPAAAYSPLAASRFTTAANKIVTNFINLPQYQLTANGLPYLQRIQAAMQNPGSVSDQDLLDSLTKLNTAGNAISDAQVKLITGGQSFSDMANVFLNKLGNGGALSNSQRQQIQSIAQSIFANYQKGYQPVYDKVTAQLKSAGIPQAFWTIPDLNNLSAQATGGSADTSTIASDIQYAIHDPTNFPTREDLISALVQHYGISQDDAAKQVYSTWTDNTKR
jgi:hypothetical protein